MFNIDRVSQAVPGVLTHEDEYVQSDIENSEMIMANTDDGSSVFILKRGDSGYVKYVMSFYCDNRVIGGYSAGPAVDEYDTYSQEVSTEQFIEDVSNYDYIYFYAVDDLFIDTYANAFEDPLLICNTAVYKVDIVDGKIRLELE